jgi:GTP-binding protein EngB required for normal cell division
MNDPEDKLIRTVNQLATEAKSNPFKVAVMGQTGVGKSSLINALFQTNLKTDPVRPCTLELEAPVQVRNSDGHLMLFYDLPGIGESGHADARYLKMYLSMLHDADVVLWLLHADSRSVSFDLSALELLLERASASDRQTVFNKIAFILAKVDLLAPPPWICARRGQTCVFAPQAATHSLLCAKSNYFADAFFQARSGILRSSTLLEDSWRSPDPRFHRGDRELIFHGYLSSTVVGDLKAKYPSGESVIERLADNHRIIPCSSLYRYNLFQVLNVLVNKMGLEAVARFQNFFASSNLSELPFQCVPAFCNIVILDQETGKFIFDMRRVRF